MLKREYRSFNFTNAEDFFVEKHQQVKFLESKKEVLGNFIKIAYSGNSMELPQWKWFRDAPGYPIHEHCKRI